MIDTVKLFFPLEVPEDDLWKYWKRESKEKGVSPDTWELSSRKYWLNTEMDGAMIKATYYPSNHRYKDPKYMLEFSIPKVLYGNNNLQITDMSEVGGALLTVNSMLDEIPGLLKVDTREGILGRLDIYYDHQVDNPDAYIRALFNCSYPQRDCQFYQGQGVRYTCGVVVTRFYNKGLESGNMENILRQETQFRKSHYIGRRLEKKDPILRHVTKDWIVSELEEDLKRLRLADGVIGNDHHVRSILTDKYGRVIANRLLHFLCDYQSTFEDGSLRERYSAVTIRRNLKAISDAGIAPSIIDTEDVLPALTIDLGTKLNRSLK
jgi:hypothetical protein